MDPIKALWKYEKDTWLEESLGALPGESRILFPNRFKNLGIFWRPQECRNSPKSLDVTGKVWRQIFDLVSVLERLLKVQSSDALWKHPAKLLLKSLLVKPLWWLHYVNKEIKFFFLKIHLVCNQISVNLALFGKMRVIIDKNVSIIHLCRLWWKVLKS